VLSIGCGDFELLTVEDGYYTVPPIGGFVEASIRLRLNRVVDLTNRGLLRKAGIGWKQLIDSRYIIPQEIGLRAWESGVEALLAPSAADPAENNLTVFLDNQRPVWRVELTSLKNRPSIAAVDGV
jgi:hypothetical protein